MSQWVHASIHVDVNHHLRRVDENDVAIAECGARLARFGLGPFPEVVECRWCADHVYARDNRKACPHCHVVPRRVA